MKRQVAVAEANAGWARHAVAPWGKAAGGRCCVLRPCLPPVRHAEAASVRQRGAAIAAADAVGAVLEAQAPRLHRGFALVRRAAASDNVRLAQAAVLCRTSATRGLADCNLDVLL